MIEITIAGHSGAGTNTLASHIATLLFNEGFDVVVDSSDKINASLATKEDLYRIQTSETVSIRTVQKRRASA